MRRDLAALDGGSFDLLVVGGGVVGACIAHDAALRGLRTALVERADFGGGASANCLKIVHGGLRYLQHLHFARMRESIRERSFWLAAAPHLVEPLPIVMPTRKGRFPPRALLGMAAVINDIVSADRNRGIAPGRTLPSGRMLSRREVVDAVPELDLPSTTGGLLFHDALMYSPERLVLEVVEAAHRAGAAVANHVEVIGPWRTNDRLAGAVLRDRLGGGTLTVRADTIVNAAGAWATHVAALLLDRSPPRPPGWSLAINFVTPGRGHRVAFAVSGGQGDPDRRMGASERQLFLVPWRGHTMIGTAQAPFPGDPASFDLAEPQVEAFRQELAGATPAVPVRPGDIAVVHAGLLPTAEPPGSHGVRILKQPLIHSHAEDGAPGLLTVYSIKFTTARRLAEDVVDQVFTGAGRAAPPCRSAEVLLPGAATDLDSLRATLAPRLGDDAEAVDHLVRTYGARCGDLLAFSEEMDGWNQRVVEGAPVIRAQLLHAAIAEMAETVEDLLCRRTELGPRGMITPAAEAAAREALELARAPSSPGRTTAPHPGPRPLH